MAKWQDNEDTADTEDETGTKEQRIPSDDGLGFEEGIDDLSGEFGDFGDDLDNGFDGDELGGFGDDNSEELTELEDHAGELKNEVSAVLSGMNTVREENRQIGETVEELDDTIYKLPDTYEMVTHGIDSFVDDAREMGDLSGGGAFGLFEAEAEDEEYLNPEVANADTESFFDDDFGELDTEEGMGEAELAVEGELAETERESLVDVLNDKDNKHGEAGEVDEADNAGDAGGASFDDLKEQHGEGGDWGDEDDVVAGDAGAGLDDVAVDLKGGNDNTLNDVDPFDSETTDDAGEDDEPGGEMSGESEISPASEIEGDGQDADGDVRRALDELEAEYATAAGTKDELSDDDEDGVVMELESSAPAEESGAHLVTLPSSYVSGALILEQVEHLVTVGDTLGVSRALRQYREQNWISHAVKSELNTHVGQIALSVEDADDHEPRIDDRRTSLAYVRRLAGNAPRGQLYEKLVAYGGRFDGTRY